MSDKTVEELQKELEEARADAEKWKTMSRKNEEGKKANADAAKEAADLKARLDAIEGEKLTAEQQTAKRIADLEASVKTADEARRASDLAALRIRIAADKELPPAFASRLTGDDEEAIAADADALLAALPKSDGKPQWPELGQGKGSEKPGGDNPLLDTLTEKLGL